MIVTRFVCYTMDPIYHIKRPMCCQQQKLDPVPKTYFKLGDRDLRTLDLHLTGVSKV